MRLPRSAQQAGGAPRTRCRAYRQRPVPGRVRRATASGQVIEVESGRTGFRYVAISETGVKGPPDTTPFLARLPSRIIRARLGKTYLEKDAEAALLAASSLEWVLIRPPGSDRWSAWRKREVRRNPGNRRANLP